MDTLQWIASAAGIGFLSGIRLYLTLLVLGAALRWEWLTLSPAFSTLTVLADTKVMAVAAVAVLIEFVADKVPWLDSAWDSIHTVIRPVGAIVLTVAASEALDPGLRFLLVLLTGGAALGSHSAKAATRLAVNHSPEPFSNWALSLAGDALIPFGVWLTMEYPLVIGAGVGLFLIACIVAATVLYRVLRVQLLSLAALWAPGGAGRRWLRCLLPSR